MELDSDHAVDTVIIGLQKIHEEARQLGLHEVAHLANTALLAAEDEAERRIILRRGVPSGRGVRSARERQAAIGQVPIGRGPTDQPQAGQSDHLEIREAV